MIYFVQAEGDGPIKIGTTIRLSGRLRSLEKEGGKPLCVLAVMDGGLRVEKELHGRFATHRMTGEWFHPAIELHQFIEREGRQWDGRDDVPSAQFNIQCGPKWQTWVKGFAAQQRCQVPDLIDQALLHWARDRCFTMPPTRGQ